MKKEQILQGTIVNLRHQAKRAEGDGDLERGKVLRAEADKLEKGEKAEGKKAGEGK